MDDRRFDDLTRALGGARSRRQLLRALAGAAAAALLPVAGQAARCGRAGEPCGCCRIGLTCTNGTCCPNDRVCNGACCPSGQVCQGGACVRSGGGGGGTPGGCPTGQAKCGQGCVAITTDVKNCGACGIACPASTDPCQIPVCTNGVCGFGPGNDDAACPGDGNRCYGTFVCAGGVCVGTNPVTCTALDQCHDAGTCDPATGACSNPNKADDSPCNDGNACSEGDTCQAGVCQPGTRRACTTTNPCLTASCDPVQGCVTTAKTAGTACGDGSACNGDEVCDATGNCVAGTPVTCGPCTVCDTTSGQCLPANEGGACPGNGNKCFGSFVCQAGTCTGVNPVVCSAPDQCHFAGTCDPATGLCSNPDRPDRTPCTDNNLCTSFDFCQQGVCRGEPVDCDDGLACTDDVCDPATGCTFVLRPGSCLIAETCYAAEDRDPANPCQRCDPAQATDAWSNAPLGTACDDATLCNGREACDGAGACQPGIPVNCPPSGACQDDGVCDPQTGECTYAPKAVGTVCRAATEPCKTVGVCDGTNPECPPNEIAVGRACDDGDPCTEGDACQADGACAGTPASCDDGPACTDGFCDPDLGCLHTVKPGSCFIEGACYAAGELDPESTCQHCDPTRNERRWTRFVDGTPCDGACVTGATCVIGICGGGEVTTDGCAIDGVCYPAGATRPGDSCHVCDPARSQTMWSLQADGTPCAGTCRTGGTCQFGNCAGGTVATGFCHIEGICIPAGEAHPVVGPCLVCDPARNAESWTVRADGTPCPNLCLANPTCQSGVCAGEEAVVCEQPRGLKAICQRAVCDPETGGCVVQPTPDLRGDTKGCVVCPLCVDGVCIADLTVVDCGPCGVCNPFTGTTCAPAPAGADCGSDCTTRRQCNSAGVCEETTGGCFNIGACEANVCDPETGRCVETGANDGKSCGDNPCRVCRGGACGEKSCGACQRCDPTSGQCVACEPCCDGVCGQTLCDFGNNCCDPGRACCTDFSGRQVCRPPDEVCEGMCLEEPAQCCGRILAGGILLCGLDQICCPADLIRRCCNAATEVCGAFGCVTRF